MSGSPSSFMKQGAIARDSVQAHANSALKLGLQGYLTMILRIDELEL